MNRLIFTLIASLITFASISASATANAASIVQVTFKQDGKVIALMTYTGPDGGPDSDPTQYWNLLTKPARFAYDVKINPDEENRTTATLKGKITVSIQIRNKFHMGTAETDELKLTRENAESNKWHFSEKELKRVTALATTGAEEKEKQKKGSIGLYLLEQGKAIRGVTQDEGIQLSESGKGLLFFAHIKPVFVITREKIEKFTKTPLEKIKLTPNAAKELSKAMKAAKKDSKVKFIMMVHGRKPNGQWPIGTFEDQNGIIIFSNKMEKQLGQNEESSDSDSHNNVNARTLKVFILAGQSNMVGHGKVEFGRNPNYDKEVKGSPREIKGGIGGLRNLSTDPATSKEYRHLLDRENNWIQRDDVLIYSTAPGKEKGKLSVGFGKGNWFGPELGFGTVVGNHFEEPVLIIKTAWGGKDLAVDFRPPTSGETKLAKNRQAGAFYRQMMTIVRDRLKNYESDFPELKGCKPEIAGFGWHQGWNDGCSKEMTAEYEKNMANFITDVRKELGAPNLPFVIANTGQNGAQTKGTFAELCQAQMNIGDAKKHPEFRGTVTSIDTRPFKATEDLSPSGFGYHWNHSGETHYKIGESMGQAMVKLINNKSEK